MFANIMITGAACARPSGREGREKNAQRGVTLIELMVGLAIGLLVIAVATVGLMASRGISGTVSDASGIQQQAAFAMRVIGQQLRQTGSLRLAPDPNEEGVDSPALMKVGFELGPSDTSTFNPDTQTLAGTGTTVSVGYRRYPETVYAGGTAYLMRNCLGGPDDSNTTDEGVISNFTFNDNAADPPNTLLCNGEPIVQNVAAFQVRYLVQNNAAPGNSTIQYVAAGGVGNWNAVQAVEVCLELYGDEKIDMPEGSSYTGCNGNATNMTTLAGARANRMHIAYRNVFQLRSPRLQ